MIKLISFPAVYNVKTGTPFGLKLMALLKLADLPYELEYQTDPRKAPAKKFPLIVDDGKTLADSHFIKLHLEKKYGIDFDEGLSVEERARSLALVRMLEEHLYWCMMYDRWVDENNWPRFKATVFKDLPPVIGGFIAKQIRKQTIRDCHGQGVSRHSRDSVMALGLEDLKALEVFLGDKNFLFGDRPTSADASAAAFLAFNLNKEFPNPLYEFCSGSPSLSAYAAKTEAMFFPLD